MNPMSETTDILLRDIARKIQLSPTLYNTAVERYETIYTHLRREGSALKDLVVRVYPQGSMMTGSSISSKVDTDEFDIDLILELGIAAENSPRVVLDELFKAVAGEKGSRYHDVTERQTRCVTVNYADMHLDITPARLLVSRTPRTSHIYHSKMEEPAHKDKVVTANPFGFGEWFAKRTPLEQFLQERVLQKRADPVKEQDAVEDKSLALVSLQLIKRWRNLRYANRNGRKPPSVMISKLVGDAATGRNRSLHTELMHQVSYQIAFVEAATKARKLVYVDNPACPGDDAFTDRWPETLTDQELFLADLETFKADLIALTDATIDQKANILMRLFGESATRYVIEEFNKRLGATAAVHGLHHDRSTGAVALRASGISSAYPVSSTTSAAPKHTFFGDQERPNE